MDRDMVYQIGKNYLANMGDRYGRFNAYQKSRKLAPKLDMRRINDALSKPCARHSQSHTCLDMFRSYPTSVLRWRKFWYTLPKSDRDDRLRSYFRKEFEAHKELRSSPKML